MSGIPKLGEQWPADHPNRHADPWAERIRALGWVLLGMTTVLGPIYLSVRQEQNKSEIKKEIKEELASAKEEVKSVADQAAANAKVAATASDANLKQWKAYKTQDPQDLDAAREAIARVESYVPNAASPPNRGP